MTDPRAENCRAFAKNAEGLITGVELRIIEHPEAPYAITAVYLIFGGAISPLLFFVLPRMYQSLHEDANQVVVATQIISRVAAAPSAVYWILPLQSERADPGLTPFWSFGRLIIPAAVVSTSQNRPRPTCCVGPRDLSLRHPWRDSNSRFRLRRPTLYPLSYRGGSAILS